MKIFSEFTSLVCNEINKGTQENPEIDDMYILANSSPRKVRFADETFFERSKKYLQLSDVKKQCVWLTKTEHDYFGHFYCSVC